MNVEEEYEDERGSKDIKDISSYFKGSSYEVEEDEKRFTSNEEQATPLVSSTNKVLKRLNPTNTPSPKARAHVFTIFKCSIFCLRFLFFSMNSSLLCQP
jgi:hypothetical protein